MKKVIFLILSFLLITPVFAENIYPNRTKNTAISFESLTQSDSLTYLLSHGYNNSGLPSYIKYIGSNGGISDLVGIHSSLNQSGYGSSINVDYLSSIFQYGASVSSSQFQGYPLLAFHLSGGLPILGYNSLYLQSSSNGGGNYLLSFGSNSIDYSSSYTISDSYIRYFYNTGLGFSGRVPTYSDIFKNPVGIQVFGSSLYTLTNKGKVYDYAGINSINKTWVVSSYFDGYSYIISSGDSYSFHSVLPGFSNFVSGTYNIPKYLETDKFLLFRGDGNKYNGSNNIVGVLQIIGTGVYYSKYNCSGLSYTDIGSGYYLNLSESCVFIDGGMVDNYSRGNSCGFANLNSLLSKTTYGSCLSAYYGNFLSLRFVDSSLVVSSTSFGSNSYTYNNFPFSLTSIYGFDILSGFNNLDVPPDPLTTGGVVDVLDSICKSAVIKPPYCQNGGLVDLSGDLEGMWYVDLSGNLVYTIIGTNPNNLGSFDLVPNGSGGFDVICTDDLFGCTLSDNLGLSGATIGGSSGFILPLDYYDNFFTKTGYFAKCPYPYTDVNVGLHSKFLNKVGDKLGFDVFLPVNCFIAAFSAGKSYKFLSDVNLGTDPLMGQIQGPDDPRVYLYRFFDFLLAFALFIFLLKIYHLLN